MGGLLFMPKISAQMGMAQEHESDTGTSIIPSLAISKKLNDNWYFGIGIWGTAGMGIDYSQKKQIPNRDSGNMHMETSLQLMQFGASLAYHQDGFGVAVTPIAQYGRLDIKYQSFDGSPIGDDVSSDLAFGLNLGAYYDFKNGLTVGTVYKSKIDMKYGNQLSTATQPFANFGIFPQAMAEHLEQPGEVGIGIGYKFGTHTLALDYKKVQWAEAKGYKEFGWKDQDVYAVGYQLKFEQLRFRLGYNYASHPISGFPSGPAVIHAGDYAQAGGNALNLFNLLGFPATAEQHYTVGGGYEFSNNLDLDWSYVYAPKTSTKMNTIVGMNSQTGDLYTGESIVNHTESSLSLQLSYRFF
jgi:long-chain fatty acid transport protein